MIFLLGFSRFIDIIIIEAILGRESKYIFNK